MILSPPPENHTHDHTFLYLKTHKLIFCKFWQQTKYAHTHAHTHSPIHLSYTFNQPITCTIQSYFATGQKWGQHAHQHNRAHIVPPLLTRLLPSSSWNLVIRSEHHEVPPLYSNDQTFKMAERKAATGFHLNGNKNLYLWFPPYSLYTSIFAHILRNSPIF